MSDDFIAVALSQQECALVRDGMRLVVMLDGRTVHVHRGGDRSEKREASESDARDSFIAVIRAALDEGFAPMHRDPPKTAVTPIVRAPAPKPIPAPVPAPKPKKPALADALRSGDLQVERDVVRVVMDGMYGLEWSDLTAVDGAKHLEIYIVADAEDSFAHVAEAGLPPWTTGLTLGTFEGIEEYDESELDVAMFASQLGALTRLELRAGSIVLPPLKLEQLEHLEVWCQHADAELVAAIAASSWPRVKTARFWLGDLEAAEVAPLLEPKLFPALEKLRIEGVDGELPERAHGDFPDADGIELMSTGEFFPLRSGRFNGF